jgi:hypothetical protein
VNNLKHVLNLVRHEAERVPPIDDPFPMTAARARNLIESAALLVRRAALAPAATLTEISDRATRCQCSRALGRHCGDCEPEKREDTCAA